VGRLSTPVPSSLPAPIAGELATTRFAVVDVETNGLRSRRHRVIQVAVVTVTGTGAVLDRWVTDVRPRGGRVGPREVHGITRERLRHAPPFRSVAAELVGRLDGAVLVAHNLGFDWGFLRNEFGRAGYRPPSPRRLDTLRLSRGLDPERLVGHSLADLTTRYGVPNGRAHDALADAEATAAVLPQLLASARVTTLDELSRHLWGRDGAWPPYATSRRVAARWWLGRLRPRLPRRVRYRLARRRRARAAAAAPLPPG
jgi:DNA polymerase-3 subunit epsilon